MSEAEARTLLHWYGMLVSMAKATTSAIPSSRPSDVSTGLRVLFRAVVALVAAARIAVAQQPMPPPLDNDPSYYITPVVPMQPVSLDRSLAKPVATGWHVVGVTL